VTEYINVSQNTKYANELERKKEKNGAKKVSRNQKIKTIFFE